MREAKNPVHHANHHVSVSRRGVPWARRWVHSNAVISRNAREDSSLIGVVSVALRLCSCTLPKKIQRANVCVPWLIHMCAMTHSYVCHDSFICVPWLGTQEKREAVTPSKQDSFIYVTWLIHMWYVTNSDVWHDSFIYVTWEEGGCHTIKINPSQYQNIKIVDGTSAMLLAAKDAYDRLSETRVSEARLQEDTPILG